MQPPCMGTFNSKPLGLPGISTVQSRHHGTKDNQATSTIIGCLQDLESPRHDKRYASPYVCACVTGRMFWRHAGTWAASEVV